MPPIVSIVGRSKSGKTTLIEKLIVELKSRGYHVATAKHTHRNMTLPESDKDSDRHLKAGSEASLIVDPHGLMMIKPLQKELTLAQIAQIIGEDYDLILTEGYKQDDAPKIEVHRKENAPPLTDVKKLFAVVTDEPLDTKVRQFALDDVKAYRGFTRNRLHQTEPGTLHTAGQRRAHRPERFHRRICGKCHHGHGRQPQRRRENRYPQNLPEKRSLEGYSLSLSGRGQERVTPVVNAPIQVISVLDFLFCYCLGFRISDLVFFRLYPSELFLQLPDAQVQHRGTAVRTGIRQVHLLQLPD
jgi:molybdopterin-guanine dinucleotide biosynthesis protein B